MLELQDVSLFVGRGEAVQAILADITLKFPRRHFAAVIGPSGCGKSTLLKTIAGIAHGREEGDILWDTRNLVEHDFAPSEIGYVPQFSIAHEELTARECVEAAVKLRLRGARGEALDNLVENTLAEVGLTESADRFVSVLSGGQKRRLALAMEIASAPAILLCDEVTSGLDAQSEDEVVFLLRELANHDRLVVSVTHSLRHLDLYDSVAVLTRGALAYHGPPDELAHYFRVENLEALYARLEEREAADWAASWRKHSAAYTAAIYESAVADEIEAFASATASPPPDLDETIVETAGTHRPPAGELPGPLSQFATLLARRFRIFFRSRGQLFLQLGLILGFPVLVAIFAWNGLPEVRNLSVGLDLNVARQLAEALDFLKQASKVGSLVSGIVMFQVILLTLMGANNSGREIAAERLIFEKEKLSGLRCSSYIASKAAFLFLLVAAQSVWMGLFVHFVCDFPGELGAQLFFLLLVNAAMTSICLGISAWMATAEQASLVSIYLVGFQLPLSGAVLALPEWIGQAVRPFISAYWSWSGVLQTLRGERYYDIVQMVVQTALSPAALCAWVLLAHVIIGLVLAWLGSRTNRMS
ncbi:MAG: ATP-binding cassette domain-containing protein [Terrimicrobiaceae bacterium]|nr:ATP-binding cassette domain-containing protein [Terrimicrobiaceae bacterium]